MCTWYPTKVYPPQCKESRRWFCIPYAFSQETVAKQKGNPRSILYLLLQEGQFILPLQMTNLPRTLITMPRTAERNLRCSEWLSFLYFMCKSGWNSWKIPFIYIFSVTPNYWHLGSSLLNKASAVRSQFTQPTFQTLQFHLMLSTISRKSKQWWKSCIKEKKIKNHRKCI